MLLTLLILGTVGCNKGQQTSCCDVREDDLKQFQHIQNMSHKFVIVIGVQKSGSTLMYDILTRHPSTVGLYKQKIGTGTHYFDKGSSGFQSYLDQFNLSALEAGFTMVEASPSYILSMGAACKIKNYLPNAKLIVVLKNPADRVLSQFKMGAYSHMCECKLRTCKPCGKPLPSFYAGVQEDIENFRERNCDLFKIGWQECFGCYVPTPTGYIIRGMYASQIQSWLQYFPPQQILIVNHRDTYNLQQTASKIYEFAGLEPYQLREAEGFMGLKHEPTSDINRTLEMLEDLYKPYNQKFYDLIAKEFQIQDFSFH